MGEKGGEGRMVRRKGREREERNRIGGSEERKGREG